MCSQRSFSFTKKYRLLNQREFRRVRTVADFKKRLKSLGVYCSFNGLSYPRLGIVVPKRIVPKAVDRNYYKRVIREIFRIHRTKLKALDMLFFINSHGKKEVYSQVLNVVTNLSQ